MKAETKAWLCTACGAGVVQNPHVCGGRRNRITLLPDNCRLVSRDAYTEMLDEVRAFLSEYGPIHDHEPGEECVVCAMVSRVDEAIGPV